MIEAIEIAHARRDPRVVAGKVILEAFPPSAPSAHLLQRFPEIVTISMSTRRNLTPSQKAIVSANAIERYTPESAHP